MEEVSNVVPFPKLNKRASQDPNAISERIFQLKLETVDELLDLLMPLIYGVMGDVGIEVLSEEKMQIVERALESVIMEHYGYDDDFGAFIRAYLDFTDQSKETTEVVHTPLVKEA